MIRLVVSDMDGTLLKEGTRDLHPGYPLCVQKLKELGITFCIGSGRGHDSINRVWGDMVDEMYIIGNNGSSLAKGREILYARSIPEHLIRNIIEKTEEIEDRCDILLSAVDHACLFKDASPVFVDYIYSYGFEVQFIDRGDPLPETLHIGIYHDPERPHPMIAHMDRFGNGVESVISGREWVDFMPAGISKGDGVHFLQTALGLTPAETMVFGDEANDVSMLLKADYSFSVENATPPAKAAARYGTASVRENGVLQVLQKLIENQGVWPE